MQKEQTDEYLVIEAPKIGTFLPMTDMLVKLAHLVSITKATATNPADLKRELEKIKRSAGVDPMNSLVKGAITGAKGIMDFPEVMRAACGEGEEAMARRFASMDKSRLDEALVVAAGGGFTHVIEALLRQGADANASSWTSFAISSALMWASFGGHTHAIGVLLRHNAEVNAMHGNFTALTLAGMAGQTAAIDLLVHHQADVNKTDDIIGYTALVGAAFGGHTAAIKALVRHGANINVATKQGVSNACWGTFGSVTGTALMEASAAGHLDAVEVLLQNSADPNIRQDGIPPSGKTALAFASEGGQAAIADLLIRHGATE